MATGLSIILRLPGCKGAHWSCTLSVGPAFRPVLAAGQAVLETEGQGKYRWGRPSMTDALSGEI